MICILAGSERDAWQWARSQLLDKSEWFYADEAEDLYHRENFHVVVVSTAYSLPPAFFEKLYNLAKTRGRMNRK